VSILGDVLHNIEYQPSLSIWSRYSGLLGIATAFLYVTLVVSGACLLLLPNASLFFPPFVFATAGWMVLLIGSHALRRLRIWGLRCALIGCLLQWICYGFFAINVILKMKSPFDIFDFGIFESLLLLPIIPLAFATFFLTILNVTMR
jgi:hypothetical protein